MMYDELVKSLRMCEDGEKCDLCTKWLDKKNGGLNACQAILSKEAADAIEKLWELFRSAEKDNAKLTAWYVEKCNKHKWIPVTERLPDESFKNVLCCGARGGMFVGWVATKPENGKIMAFVHGGHGRYITHWMPLPQPPKDGE